MSAHDILQALIDAAPEESVPVPARNWVVDGQLVRSVHNRRITARIEIKHGLTCLDFTWDSNKPKSIAAYSEQHIRKHYKPIP